MININSILAGLTPVAGFAKTLNPSAPDVPQSPPAVQERDTFSRGEHWQNRGHLNVAKEDGGSGVLGQVERAYEGQPYLAVPTAPSRPQQSSDSKLEEAKPIKSVDNQQNKDVYQAETDETSEGQKQSEASLIGSVTPDGTPLSSSDKQLLAQLQKADIKVKAHERAHLAAAGGYATGGASYKYQQGPDGKKYAVSGEVPIDVGKETTPEQTLAKMRIVRQAALAPADPSPQDQSVAARATIMIAEAAQELRVETAAKENVLQNATDKDRNVEGDDVSTMNKEPANNNSIQVDFNINSGQKRSSFPGNVYSSDPSSGNSQSQSGLNMSA